MAVLLEVACLCCKWRLKANVNKSAEWFLPGSDLGIGENKLSQDYQSVPT